MKQTITILSCDICKISGEGVLIKHMNYPVVFDTDDVEGRPCKPYLSNEKIDVCQKCEQYLLENTPLTGYGMSNKVYAKTIKDTL